MNTAAQFQKLATTVTGVATEVARLTCRGNARSITVEFENVSGGAINSFEIKLYAHDGGSAFSFLKDTDFQGALNDNLRFATTIGPNQVTAGQKAQFTFEPGAAYLCIFYAVSASSTVVNLRGTEQQG